MHKNTKQVKKKKQIYVERLNIWATNNNNTDNMRIRRYRGLSISAYKKEA